MVTAQLVAVVAGIASVSRKSLYHVIKDDDCISEPTNKRS